MAHKRKGYRYPGYSIQAENMDDIQEAAAIRMIHELRHGANLTVYDPVTMPNTRKVFGEELTYVDPPLKAVKQKDRC